MILFSASGSIQNEFQTRHVYTSGALEYLASWKGYIVGWRICAPTMEWWEMRSLVPHSHLQESRGHQANGVFHSEAPNYVFAQG